MGIQDTNLMFAIGKLPQTNYLTATAASGSPKSYIEQVLTEKSFIKKEVPTENDKGHTTGQRFAKESWVKDGHNTMFSMPFQPTFQNIGRYLNAVKGICDDVPLEDEQDGLFRHLFDLLDTKVSSQLPAYTIIEHAAPSNNGMNVKAPSMVAKALKLSGDGAARIKASMDWIGSGEYVQPSGVTWATHVESTQGTQVPIYNTTASLIRSDAPGGGNAVTRSLCENLGWELNITNSFDEADYGCVRLFDEDDVSKGVLRSHLLLMDTEISSKFKFKLPASSTEMTLLENQSPLKLFFSLLSTESLVDLSQILNFDMPLNKYKVVDHSSENGFIYLTIEPDSLYSTTDNYVLQTELINDVEAYTA